MVEQASISKTRRRYQLRVRAEAMERTRQRITDAAIELHGTVGPRATTLSAVAARAGVTRATLYRHFPDEAALFGACSRHWLAGHPRPVAGDWSAIRDSRMRVRVALRALYSYYGTNAGMLGNLHRDASALPEAIARNLASYPRQMLEVLDVGWPGGPSRVRRAAILHAVAFETWRSLRAAGLGDEAAADLMGGLVNDADDRT
jgi:AcrR family transcriptional regulator